MGSEGEAQSSTTLFAPLKHPELRRLGSKSIQTFLAQREQYLLRAKDAEEQGSTFKPISLTNSVEFKLLKALVQLGTFEGVQQVSELSDVALKKWLELQLEDALENVTAEELQSMLKKKVRTDMAETDPKLRIIALFTDYISFLEEYKLQEIIESNPKLAVQHICKVLRPAALKNKVENDLELHKTDLRKDWKGFFDYVVEKAIVCEEFHKVSDNGNNETSGMTTKQGSSSSRSGFKVKGKPWKRQSVTKDRQIETRRTAEKDVVSDPNLARPASSAPFCLNTVTCPGE